jgi:hypothetical protein
MLCMAVLAPLAAADIVRLVNGRELEGVIIAEERDTLTLATRIGTITLSRSQIEAVLPSEYELPPKLTREESLRERYHTELGELDPDDGLGLARLARWAASEGLDDEAGQAEALALAIAPEDDAVREALGHIRTREGGWQTPAEHWRARGLVLHEGEWVSPGERARRIATDHSQQAHRKRRELAIRARVELPSRLKALATARPEARGDAVRGIRERLDAYAEEGEPWLQRMPPRHRQLVEALELLVAGEIAEARDACADIVRACEGVQRWESEAALALEVGAVRMMLAEDVLARSTREREAARRINAMRREMGMEPLAFDERLYHAALGHVLDMIQGEYVAHDSPTPGRRDADERGHAQGVRGQIGENIYHGSVDAESAVRGWGKSLGHAQNMFEPLWRRGGLAAVGRHWVHNFAE